MTRDYGDTWDYGDSLLNALIPGARADRLQPHAKGKARPFDRASLKSRLVLTEPPVPPPPRSPAVRPIG